MQADGAAKKIIESEKFKKKLAKLSGDTLIIMSRNREIACNYARGAIEKTEPEKLNDEYIELVATGLQNLAKVLLEKRST